MGFGSNGLRWNFVSFFFFFKKCQTLFWISPYFYRFGHQDSVSCITSGVSCDFLSGGSKDGTVRLWKTTEEVQLVFNHPQGASVEAIDKVNAEFFTTVGDNGQICIWSGRKKTPICTKMQAHGTDPINDMSRWISSLAVLNCSDLIATGNIYLFWFLIYLLICSYQMLHF